MVIWKTLQECKTALASQCLTHLLTVGSIIGVGLEVGHGHGAGNGQLWARVVNTIQYTAIFSKHTLHLPKPCEFYLYLGDEPVNALNLNVSSQRNPTTKGFDRYKIWFLFKAVLTVKKKVWKLGWTLGQVAWTAFWVIAVVIYGANVWRGWIVWVVQRLLVNIVV